MEKSTDIANCLGKLDLLVQRSCAVVDAIPEDIASLSIPKSAKER